MVDTRGKGGRANVWQAECTIFVRGHDVWCCMLAVFGDSKSMNRHTHTRTLYWCDDLTSTINFQTLVNSFGSYYWFINAYFLCMFMQNLRIWWTQWQTVYFFVIVDKFIKIKTNLLISTILSQFFLPPTILNFHFRINLCKRFTKNTFMFS